MFARLALTALLLSLPTPISAQQFGPAQFAIRADDGDLLSNHSVSAEQAAQLERLTGVIVAGNPNGDVSAFQFYDLNCPFCREAARDVDALVAADRNLRLVFVPYPTLSFQSAEGARIEHAVRELAPPQRWLEFRKRMYAGRGTIDGARGLSVIREMKLNERKVIEIANAPRTTAAMMANANLGAAMKMIATPSYVIGNVAVLGHPGLEPLRRMVQAVRTCKAPVC